MAKEEQELEPLYFKVYMRIKGERNWKFSYIWLGSHEGSIALMKKLNGPKQGTEYEMRITDKATAMPLLQSKNEK